MKARPPRLALLGLTAATLALAAAAATPGPVRAQDAHLDEDCAKAPASLDVTVEGVRNGKGLITFTLYADNRKKFLAKGASMARFRVDAKAGITQGCVPLPAPGAYLLAVFHDENSDHVLNRSFIGLPKEGFGFSNNAPALVGLPSFDAVRFVAKPGKTPMRIKLHYLSGKEKLPAVPQAAP